MWPADNLFDVKRDNPTECDDPGIAAMPVIVETGPHTGRLIVAYWGQEGGHNADPARVLYRNPDLQWSEAPIIINQILQSGVPTDVGAVNHSHVPGEYVFNTAPGIAIDRASNDIYVVFSGEVTGEGNPDLFVTRLVVDQVTGVISYLPALVLRLTDTMLGETAGAAQIMPALAIDQYGGLNILYYSINGDGIITPKYLRIRSFAVPLTTPLVVRQLAAPFSAPPGRFIGDYQGIATGGCLVYPCYMAHAEGQVPSIFVNRINLCIADVSIDGDVNSLDLAAFASSYIASSPEADLDQDSAVDASDLLLFQQGYTCECGSP
jgi:hypothetical protein